MDHVVIHCDDASTFYKYTIDHVIQNVQHQFLEEGYDDDILYQLKMLWINKLQNSKQQHREANTCEIPTPKVQTTSAITSLKMENKDIQKVENKIPANIMTGRKRQISPPTVEKFVAQSEDSQSENDSNSDESLDEDNHEEEKNEETINDEESLNSGDDYTDDEGTDAFNTDNLILCQYSNVVHNRNKWRFNLSHGIMCLNGEEYVFSSAKGDAEW